MKIDAISEEEIKHYQEYKQYEKSLLKKDAQIKSLKSANKRLIASLTETNSLLQQTISVKLRYQEIIEKIYQNTQLADHERTIRQIIDSTPLIAVAT